MTERPTVSPWRATRSRTVAARHRQRMATANALTARTLKRIHGAELKWWRNIHHRAITAIEGTRTADGAAELTTTRCGNEQRRDQLQWNPKSQTWFMGRRVPVGEHTPTTGETP